MAPFRSKPLLRTSLAALLVSAGLAATPGLANPQVLPVSGLWTSGDYVEAIFAVQNGVITLPRQGNPKTEAFFARLIDRGNIEPLVAGPLSLAEKRRQILIILSATGEFRGRYGYAVALGDDLKAELVAIQIFRLYLIDRLASLDMLDETYRRRCASAIATTLSGTLDTLAEAPLFSIDQLVALSLAFAQHYPAIRTKLDRKEQMAVTGRLEGMATQERDPALKTAFAAALAAASRDN
jgi:hypothetical protein